MRYTKKFGGRDLGSKGNVKKNLGKGLHLEDDREGKNVQVVQKCTNRESKFKKEEENEYRK